MPEWRGRVPIASELVLAKPIQPFMAARCSVGPVYSGRCLKLVSIKIQLGLSGQVVRVYRFEIVSVVFSEVGDMTATIIIQTISQFFCDYLYRVT